jgi:hypothetical protein
VQYEQSGRRRLAAAGAMVCGGDEPDVTQRLQCGPGAGEGVKMWGVCGHGDSAFGRCGAGA